MGLHLPTMSLSAYPASTGATPGEDWGDSPYGSLVSLGPRKFKKKPVLVLDPEELVKAHMAMAMGGAEIMEAMPDPDLAQRPRQPSSLLGLAPIGRDDDDEDPALYPQAALDVPATDDWDEDAVEEDGPLAHWEPEEDEGDLEDNFAEDNAAEEDFAQEPVQAFTPPAPTSMDYLLRPAPMASDVADTEYGHAAPAESVIPSIEEQLKRMRALPGRTPPPAAPPPAASPQTSAPPVAPPAAPTIQRLEIDDWSQLDALKGFVPARERDVAKAEQAASTPPAIAAPADVSRPARAEAPVTAPAVAPAPLAPAASPAPAQVPVPVAPAADRPDPRAEPLPEWDAMDDEFAEALSPVAPPPRHSSLRARLVDPAYDCEGEGPRESLLGRLWAWLTRRR